MNGEDIQAFEFGSAEEADAAAGGVSANGLSILTTMADGTKMASMVDWFAPVHYYKAGKLIVLYVGGDSDVNNALQEAMGPQFAGNEGPTQAPPTVGGKTPTAPIVSNGGPVKDYLSLVDNLRAAGATVDPAGTVSEDFFAPQGQLFTVNGERVETFEFGSAEEADAAAGGVSATGSSIVTTMADGTESATMITWVAPPHFYKAGKLIVIYVGSDSDVIDALQEAMGPQFAGGESLPPAPGGQPVQGGMGMIAPNLRLTFDGAEYTGVEILGAASPNGPIVCCGTPINMDDMEVVGTGIWHKRDGDATFQLYRPKANGTTDVYTFHPAQTRSKVEGAPPADEADTTPATWTRWIAK